MDLSLSKHLSRVYLWLAERLYYEFAWAYDLVSWIVTLGKWDAIRKLALGHLSGRKILEIGYGTGELLLNIDPAQHTLYGLELSPAMMRQAKQKLLRHKIDVACIGGDARCLPLADSSIDTIISTIPSGYILEASTWSEAGRVLRNPVAEIGNYGGRFIMVGIVLFFRSRGGGKMQDRLGRGDEILALCEKLAENADMKPRIIFYSVGFFEIPVLIADKYIYN